MSVRVINYVYAKSDDAIPLGSLVQIRMSSETQLMVDGARVLHEICLFNPKDEWAFHLEEGIVNRSIATVIETAAEDSWRVDRFIFRVGILGLQQDG